MDGERIRARAELTVTPFVAIGKAVRQALSIEAERLARLAEPDADTFALEWSKSVSKPPTPVRG